MNDHLPFHDLLEDFQATLRRAGCLAFIVLVIGVFVPGLIQYKRGTFFREDIIEKIDNKDVMQKIKNYDKMHYEILKAINAIEDKIIQNAKNLPPEEILEFTKLYDQLDNFISQKRNPYHIATVYLDPLIVVWILFYISFTWLFFLLAPKIKVTLSPWEYFTFFIGIWLFFRFPTWMRNFTPFRNLDRKVYAGTNFDIDRVSFFTQEFQAAIVCFLITIVLLKWSSYFIMWRHNVISVIIEKGRDSTPQLIQAITRQFIHWQICSIFIAVAFIPWTYFFGDMLW